EEEQQDDGDSYRQRRFAAAPTPGFLKVIHRTRMDWFVAQETLQIAREFLCRGIAFVGLFLQALQADGFEVAWDLWIELARANRVVFQHLAQGGFKCVCKER